MSFGMTKKARVNHAEKDEEHLKIVGKCGKDATRKVQDGEK